MVDLPHCSDSDLPDLRTIILPRRTIKPSAQPPRRSPRKISQAQHADSFDGSNVSENLTLFASSTQRYAKSTNMSPSKRSPLKMMKQPNAVQLLSENAPVLRKLSSHTPNLTDTRTGYCDAVGAMDLSVKPPSMSRSNKDSGGHNPVTQPRAVQMDRRKTTRSVAQQVIQQTQESRQKTSMSASSNFKTASKRPTTHRFILGEVRCNDDAADSDANDDGDEDNDTDLSGFIVDDAAELSYYASTGSESEQDSESDRRSRRKLLKTKPQRRLLRGRKHVSDSEDEGVVTNKSIENGGDDLIDSFRTMTIKPTSLEDGQSGSIEVIDLISSDPESPKSVPRKTQGERSVEDDLLTKLKGLKLSPPRSITPINSLVPHERTDTKSFTTPPATPPRSPSKLRSPSKKLGTALRLPQRPSLDAFWDHNVVNELNDQYSPRKAPMTSPRKILERFHLWSDSEDNEVAGGSGDSSDSVPSPCESPTKARRSASPLKSPEKAEKKRIQEQKQVEVLKKKAFEDSKDRLAQELLSALDKNVTLSKLSAMTSSTGGVQIIWSKTLRSTAGRAQWRRTVTKATGSPIKGSTSSSSPAIEGPPVPGTIIKHFAKIELATKIIDRPERLVSTLTHEFCHLANYMVSGIRDQPHGASFHDWGRKCTRYLREQSGRPEWRDAEVATKHNYEIDFKYLWICAGRPRTLAMDFLNMEDDEGCGVEYGRHSKSVDPDKHRCGRCKGRLVQVRPKPRAASPKKGGARSASPVKSSNIRRDGVLSGTSKLMTDQSVEVVELSD